MSAKHRHAPTSRAKISLLLILACVSVAQLVSAPSATAGGPSTELRVSLLTPSSRRSDPADDFSSVYDASWLYFDLGLGIRHYPGGSHGVYADLGRRFDLDVDGIFDEYDNGTTHFFLTHAGYAYRHAKPHRRRSDTHWWSLSARAGLAAGMTDTQSPQYGIPVRSPVLGPSFGLDIDFHYGRFFFGWALSYDLLFHTRGSTLYSNFIEWSVSPLGRIGFTFGERLQYQPPAPLPDGSVPIEAH